jgi:hypothetical protein
MMNTIHGAFWRGFGSVIVIRPSRRKEMRFTYKGREITDITTREAIESDWSMVSHDLMTALKDSQNEQRAIAKTSR